MPMKYNEDTGVPYFVPDTAIELEEGVTPAPDVLRYGKRGIFAGDPPPKFDNGLGQKPIDSTTHSKGERDFFAKLHGSLVPKDEPIKGAVTQPKAKGAVDLGKLYDEAMDGDIAKHATPAALSATIATDAEIEELQRLCSERSVMHWPTLLRLINRLRMTEELLAAARRDR